MAQTNPRVKVMGSANANHQATSNTHGALTRATYDTATQNSVTHAQHLQKGNAMTNATISGLNNVAMPVFNNNQYQKMQGQGVVVV